MHKLAIVNMHTEKDLTNARKNIIFIKKIYKNFYTYSV